MNRLHSDLNTTHRTRAHPGRAGHPMATTCSDKAALCMAIPAIAGLLFGLWWIGML
jgi:hypothetical protein